MEDQRVGSHSPLLARKRRAELPFDDLGVIGRRDADSVRDPQHVPIDRKTRHTQRVTEDNVRGFASDAGKQDERLHLRRDLAAVVLDERGGHADERFGLRTEETGRLDLRLELRGRRARQRPRVRIAREERRRDFVDALVRALRRQNRRDEQLVRIAEVKLGKGARMLTLELLENLADLPGRLHAA